MLHKMGIKDDDIYTNSELIGLFNIKDLWEYNIDGPEIIIGQIIIIIMLIIGSYILLYISFRKLIKANIDKNELASYDTMKKMKKYIQSVADGQINKKILIGIGLGTILAIIINLVMCFFSKAIMYKLFYWEYRLSFINRDSNS